MSKKKNRITKPDVTKETEYYKLKTDAVRDLVEANEENSPVVSEEELNKYRSGPKIKTSEWVKIVFIKTWFAGAVCFFFIWGLGLYTADLLDNLFITWLALGIVTDLLTNNVIRFFEKTQGANDRWLMITKRGYVSFPLNILYAGVLLWLVVTLYNVINIVLIAITGATDTVPLGVGPILFGLFYMGFDLLLIKCKHVLIDIFKKAGAGARRGNL